MTKKELIAAMAAAPDDAHIQVYIPSAGIFTPDSISVQDYVPLVHEATHEGRVPNGIVRIVVR